MARQIINQKVNPSHYIAYACIVWCFDARFTPLLKAFIKKKGFGNNHDLVKIAGGAKALSEKDFAEAEKVLGEIEKSVRLHHTKEIDLMLHHNCGAFGNLGMTADQEQTFLEERLRFARARVRERISGVPVHLYFADFDGVWEVE